MEPDSNQEAIMICAVCGLPSYDFVHGPIPDVVLEARRTDNLEDYHPYTPLTLELQRAGESVGSKA